MRLLTEQKSNPKTAKNAGHGYLSAILHLAPSTLSGYNVCPDASEGCKHACLNTAGRGQMLMVQQARISKTQYFIKNRSAFFTDLNTDFKSLTRRANKLGLKPVVRLNGTSDVGFELGSLMSQWPKIQFYDYTKSLKRLQRLKRLDRPNYHLTFSAAEDNLTQCWSALRLGYNVAVVFRHDLPASYLDRPVIDGDKHDLRFLDKQHPKGLIVGLLAKGLAKRDTSGFVRD